MCRLQWHRKLPRKKVNQNHVNSFYNTSPSTLTDARPIGDSGGWEVDAWGDFETEHPPQKDTKSSDRDAERKKRQEERRLKQQQARQKRSAGLGGTKPSGLGDVKKD